MGVTSLSYPLKLDPSKSKGLIWAMDPTGPRRTFPTDTAANQDVADVCGNTPAQVRQTGANWVNGPLGKAISFDGTHYVVGSPPPVDYTKDFTLALSLYFANGYYGYGTLLCLGGYNAGGFYLQQGTGTISCIVNTVAIPSIAYPEGQWFRYVVTLAKGSMTGTSYINAIPDSPSTFYSYYAPSSPSLYLGNSSSLGQTSVFSMADVLMWNRLWEPSEIVADTANPHRIYLPRFDWPQYFAPAATTPSHRTGLLTGGGYYSGLKTGGRL